MTENQINEAEKEYKAIKRKISAKLFAASTALSFMLTTVIHYAFYHNYTVLKSSLFSVKIPVPINLIESFVVGVVLLDFGLVLLCRRALVIKQVSDTNKKYILKKTDSDNKELTDGDNPVYAGLLIIAVAIVAIGFMSVNCFGYNDNSIRFSDSHKIIVTTAELSDFELFRLEGKYDDGKVMLYGKNAYGIVSKNGKRSYDFGNASEELEEMLLSYYHTATDMKTIEDAINYSKGD